MKPENCKYVSGRLSKRHNVARTRNEKMSDKRNKKLQQSIRRFECPRELTTATFLRWHEKFIKRTAIDLGIKVIETTPKKPLSPDDSFYCGEPAIPVFYTLSFVAYRFFDRSMKQDVRFYYNGFKTLVALQRRVADYCERAAPVPG